MFKLSSTSVAATVIAAAITLTAFAGGIDTAPEREADAPHVGDHPKGHHDWINVNGDGPFDNTYETPPGLGDDYRRPGAGGEGSSSGAVGGNDLPPGIGQGVAGTRGGPLGNEFEKWLSPPGLGHGGAGVVNYDITGDGRVDFMDLVALLSEWGAHRGAADLTGDSMVDIRDLVLFLANLPADITPQERSGPTGVEVPTERDFIRPGGKRVIDFRTAKDSD